MKYALEKNIPFIIWIGENEVKAKQFKIKKMYEKEEIVIDEGKLIEECIKLSVEYKKKIKEGNLDMNL